MGFAQWRGFHFKRCSAAVLFSRQSRSKKEIGEELPLLPQFYCRFHRKLELNPLCLKALRALSSSYRSYTYKYTYIYTYIYIYIYNIYFAYTFKCRKLFIFLYFFQKISYNKFLEKFLENCGGDRNEEFLEKFLTTRCGRS